MGRGDWGSSWAALLPDLSGKWGISQKPFGSQALLQSATGLALSYLMDESFAISCRHAWIQESVEASIGLALWAMPL